MTDAHANLEVTFYSKKSPGTAKAQTPEGEEDEKKIKNGKFKKN